jgi:hypothetical protein
VPFDDVQQHAERAQFALISCGKYFIAHAAADFDYILITRDALTGSTSTVPQWSESAAAATAPPLPFLNCFLASARDDTN